jgi:VanZ family protein
MTFAKIIRTANKYLPVLKVLTFVWLFLITLLCIVPQNDLPKVQGIPHFDKFVHFVLYFVLSFLSLFVFSGPKRRRKMILVSAIFIFSLIIELMQGILPFGRTCSTLDMLANLIGILTGLFLFTRIKYLQASDQS